MTDYLNEFEINYNDDKKGFVFLDSFILSLSISVYLISGVLILKHFL